MGKDFAHLNPSFQIPFSRICWTPSFNYIDWAILLYMGQITFLEHGESPPPAPLAFLPPPLVPTLSPSLSFLEIIMQPQYPWYDDFQVLCF